MSGATDFLGLITVEEGEAYDEEVFNTNNKTIDAQFEKLKYASASYSPTFAGLTNQGTTPPKSGSYVRIGKLVIANFYLKGGAGASLGNNTITVTLPFRVSNANEKIYYGQAGLHSPAITGAIYPLTVVANQDTTTAFLYAMSANKNALTTPGLMLYPFAANDVIRGTIVYTTDEA